MAERTLDLRSRLAEGVSLQGVQTTALNDFQTFCRTYQVDPAQFLAGAHMLRSGYREGMDYTRFLNWDRFNSFIAQNLTDAGTGLNRYQFNQSLQSELSRQRPAAAPQTGQPATGQREATPPAQRREEAPRAPAEAQAGWEDRVAAPTDQAGRVAQEQAIRIVNSYPELSDDQRVALVNMASGNRARTLIERNMQFYRPTLTENHRMSDDTADRLMAEIGAVADGALAARRAEAAPRTRVALSDEQGTRYVAPEQEQRAAEPEAAPGTAARSGTPPVAERRQPAPARTETFTYSVRIGVLGNPETVYTLTSPTAIHSNAELEAAIRNPDSGITLLDANKRRVETAPAEDRRPTRAMVADEIHTRGEDPIGYVEFDRVSPRPPAPGRKQS